MIENSVFFFWFGQPPKVEVGAYNYVSQKVKKTYYVCLRDYPEERKSLNWGSTNYGNAELVILPEDSNQRIEKIYELLKVSDDAEHIVCGVAGPMADIICPILKRNHTKFIVVSERPRISFGGIKNNIRSVGLYIKYGWVKRIKYQNEIKAFLPLGTIGVNVFRNLHWDSKRLFRFMYCGEYDTYPDVAIANGETIHFLYIGRFGFNHALDIMMSAFDKLKYDNWTLDMAGGYGEQKDIIMKWIDSKQNVNFIGKVDSSEVRNIMSKYDVVIVPSRLDGWNCQVNEALSIGCPVITHVYSVSSELVSASGAGIVVNSLDPIDMMYAFEKIVKNPDLIINWRKKAIAYRTKFEKDTVGEYLLSIIRYVNNETAEYPTCPW